MRTVLFNLSLILAGFGLGIYTCAAMLFNSLSPFDVMKKEGHPKLGCVKSLFWLAVVFVAVLVVILSVVKK